MIFLDESGVDKGSKKSGPFFIVAIASIADYKTENGKLRRFLNHEKEIFKWQKLTRVQKLRFDEYTKSLSYKVDVIYNDKKNSEATYSNMLYVMLNNKSYHKQNIIYTGLHLNSIFEKVRRKLRSIDNINIGFAESKGDQELGIQIADMWAGYVNSVLKSEEAMIRLNNLKIRKYLYENSSHRATEYR